MGPGSATFARPTLCGLDFAAKSLASQCDHVHSKVDVIIAAQPMNLALSMEARILIIMDAHILIPPCQPIASEIAVLALLASVAITMNNDSIPILDIMLGRVLVLYLVQVCKLLRIVADVKVCHSFSTSVFYCSNVKSQCCLLLGVEASKIYLLLLPDMSLHELES